MAARVAEAEGSGSAEATDDGAHAGMDPFPTPTRSSTGRRHVGGGDLAGLLLRVGEYAMSGGEWDLSRVMTPDDLQAHLGKDPVKTFRDADRVTKFWRTSKADQEGVGAALTHYRAEAAICLYGHWS